MKQWMARLVIASLLLGTAGVAGAQIQPVQQDQGILAYFGKKSHNIGDVGRERAQVLHNRLFVADIGFVETKAYVMKVFAAHAAYAKLSGELRRQAIVAEYDEPVDCL